MTLDPKLIDYQALISKLEFTTYDKNYFRTFTMKSLVQALGFNSNSTPLTLNEIDFVYAVADIIGELLPDVHRIVNIDYCPGRAP